MKNVTRLALAIAFTIIAATSFAQIGFKGCIVAEGNNFGAPGNLVKMAHYYPIEKKYVYFDSLSGDFTNDVYCDGPNTYIHVGNADATKDSFYRYDSRCHTRLNAAALMGLQKIKGNASKLVVSKGFGADSNYIEIFDKISLTKLATINEVDQMCNGIAMNGNTAYVAVNGSWPTYTDSGTVAVIDLNTNSFVKYIKLDTNARVVNKVYSRGNLLWCECDFDKIVEYNLTTDSFVIYPLGPIQGTASLDGDFISYSTYSSALAWNVVTHTTLLVDGFYGNISDFRVNPFNYAQRFVVYNDYVNSLGTFENTIPLNAPLDSFVIGLASVLDVYMDSNTAPIANNYTVRLVGDQDTTFTILVTDIDACDRLVYSISNGPHRIGASATIDAAGLFHYTPALGLIADDTVQINIADIAGYTTTSTVYIHVYDPLLVNDSKAISFEMYPNPAIDQLHIQLDMNQKYTLEVLDMLGNTISNTTLTNNDTRLDISKYQTGMYLLKLKDAQGHIATKKLFKN